MSTLMQLAQKAHLGPSDHASHTLYACIRQVSTLDRYIYTTIKFSFIVLFSFQASMMRMLRNFGRLRMLATLLVIVVMVYVIGQLRSTDQLDDVNSKLNHINVQNNQNQQAQAVIDDSMSFRKFKV